MASLTQSFVASIAHGLNSAQIPCVLWGQCLLTVHGVPSAVGSIDFIVPDDRLEDGMQVLSQLKNLTPCPDDKRCLSGALDRSKPALAVHAHLDATEVTVRLFPQADILWFLPPLDGSLLFPTKLKLPPHFVLASDDTVLPPWRLGRGEGVFKEGGTQVVVLKSHVLLETAMRIYARDAGTDRDMCGLTTVSYIGLYVDKDGFLDLNQVPEPFRTFYVELKEDRKPTRTWTLELKRALQMT